MFFSQEDGRTHSICREPYKGLNVMPAMVGKISVNAVSGGSVFHVGDVQTICPVSYAKTYAGAGSFNTGDNLRVHNGYNVTYTQDPDVNDSNNATNF